MKFLFLLWVTIRGTFDAAVWATAVWCILCYFSNVLWLQCFGIFIAIHFLSNMPLGNYIKSHTRQDCLHYIQIEARQVGISIFYGLILGPLIAAAAIVLLSLVQVWTNLETHWLHTLLFVACVVYSLSRANGKRRMVVLANTKSPQSVIRRARMVRVIDV
jgi:hypothetical protein